uniref:Integrase catalytic domain-containing protein n=1 Tax=Fagus sylvatica TaxID=28930 RepID=A0A2N9F8N5_FAGSY
MASSLQSPLMLLSSMSNLMPVKLDSTNFIVWKHQLSSILRAYSMINFVDGTVQSPSRFLVDAEGNSTTTVNPEFQSWDIRDQALLTLINSTLSPSVLPMVVGQDTAQSVWKTLEHRFTSTSRSNVLNLKIELHNLKKGSESVSSYLQKIKNSRDKLIAVGTLIDDEDLLHIILKGLPREFGPFCSSIRTRNAPVSFEEIMVLLQTEEQSLAESFDSGKDLNSMAIIEVEAEIIITEEEVDSAPTSHSNASTQGNTQFSNNQYPSSNAFTQGNAQFSQNFQGKSENSRPLCQICGKLGHQALDCYHRMDFAYQGRHPPARLAAMASTSNSSQIQAGETWLTDTGATDHLTSNLDNLTGHTPYQGHDQVAVGNGQAIPIKNVGTGQLSTQICNFQLHNLLHSPKISSNLLSVHKLCKHNNCSCYFDSNKFMIQALPSGRVLYRGLSENGLYPIHTQPSVPPSVSPSSSIQAFLSSKNKWQLWHQRLGHPSDRVLVSAIPSLSSCISVNNKHVQHHCKHCLIGKMHKLPFVSSQFQSTRPLELVHSDVWGPAPINSSNGYRFYLLFVDDYSRFSWLYLLHRKSDVLQTFKHFQASVENQLSQKIKILRTDCGGEYTSNEFNTHCASHGIIHHFSCPHTPQQNGLVERKHRHVIESALTLLSNAGLSITYWSYAVSTAVHLINRLPTPTLSHQTPWEMLFHKPPDLVHLRTFGCLCFPYLRPYTTHKLQPRTTPCLFLGYPTYSKGYICLDPHTHRVYISRHVLFNESEFLAHLSLPSQSSPSPVNSSFDSTSWLAILAHSCTPPLIPDSTPSQSVPIPPADPPVQSITPIIQSPTSIPSPAIPVTQPHTPILESSPSTAAPLPTPPSVPPLLSSTISASTNTHPMHTRSKNGIFKPKIFHTSIPDYTQTEPSTYLTASKFPQWCAAMHEEYSALQRQHTWTLVPPPCGKNIVGCKWVFKLKRNSDGTISRHKARLVAKGFHQQHGIDFAETFSPVVKPPTVRLILALAVTYNWPLRQLDQTPSLFIYRSGSTVAFLLLYVDDIVLTGNNAMFLSQLIINLSKVFELIDLGPLSFFLGLQIHRSSTGLTLTQTKYATDLLHKHHMQHCSPCKTPCVPHVRLSATEGTPLTDVHAYRSLVGALHYLTFTRPDLSFAVHQVCQFMNAPTSIHLTAAKRILRYLQGTLDHGLHYTPGPTTLSAFTDADWAGDPNDRRSTSGLLVFLGHNPITWSAKKQLTVSRSSTEAEVSSTCLCLCRTIASNPVFHARTKHIEVDFHFIRERVLRKDLQVQFVSTADQLADIFTKGLSSPRFRELQSKLMVPVATICLREDDEANGKSCSANSCTKRQ